jgi:DNA-directed RNA polymerase
MPLFLARDLKEREVGRGREEFEYVERVRMHVVETYPWWSLGRFEVERVREYYRGKEKACEEFLESESFHSLRNALSTYSAWSGEEVGEEERKKLWESVVEFYFQTRKLDLSSSASKIADRLREEFEDLKERVREERDRAEAEDLVQGYRELLEAFEERLKPLPVDAGVRELREELERQKKELGKILG